MMGSSLFRLHSLIWKASHQEPLSKKEIRFLITLKNDAEIESLFRAARNLRRRYFDDTIFLYGFIYFSTWCRNDCIFCFYRRSNPFAKRYRKEKDEIIEIGSRLAESGVHLVDLTMGEDPIFYQNRGRCFELSEVVKALREETGLPVMVSPGVVSKADLLSLALAGADWYACYQETHNRDLYSSLRVRQSFDERFSRKKDASELGFLIEEGILTGVGDSPEDIADSVENMMNIGARQVRVMTFVPQRGTPFEHLPAPSTKRELIVIAVLRLLFPNRLIPATLDVEGIAGLRNRLNAGANVITSLVPPKRGLAGVSQSSLDIESGCRTVQSVVPIIESMRLKTASVNEYSGWIDHEKKTLLLEKQSAHVEAPTSPRMT